MQDMYHRKIFRILWTFVLLLALFLGIPMLIYAMVYGFRSFELFHMIGYSGSSLMMDLFMNMIPIIMYSTVGLMWIWLLIVAIFFQKKRAYKLLLTIVWIFCFGSLLFVVVKTYAYIPKFIMSVIAWSVLVIGGFISWFSCFWGYKQKKLLPSLVPLFTRGVAVLIAYVLLSVFPDPEIMVDYTNFVGGVEAVMYAPWMIDSKEFVFAGWFLVLLWISRLMIGSVLSYQEVLQNRKYNRKYFGLLVLGISIVLSIIAYIKKDLFIAPNYDKTQYQDILTKKWYQEHIATWDNIYYRQNQWLLGHTWFLDKINQNPYIVQNYFSQTGLVQSGFIEFWKEFSGDFHKEFSNIALVSSGTYAMIRTDASLFEIMGFPEEKLRERTTIVNAVATQLCRMNQCEEWFDYRKNWFVFVNKRLESGAGIIWSLISIVTVQKSLSGAQEMLPYLSFQQKQELQSLLIPYDTWYLYHNMIVQEYFFVHEIGIENSKRFMQEQNVAAPKFLLDLEYTNYLIKKHFMEALSRQQNEDMFDYETNQKLSYNILGNYILNALLPRVSHVYNRFENLENQRLRLYEMIQK